MTASNLNLKNTEHSVGRNDMSLKTQNNILLKPANDEENYADFNSNTYSSIAEKPKNAHLRILNRKRKRSRHPLREIRLQRGFTLEELADLTGLSPSYLSRLESGSRRLNADILNRIAEILSCHPGELLPHESHTNKYSAANWSERPATEPQSTPAFAQDLPLYSLNQHISGAYILELDRSVEWITRPPEMYGVTGSFAFTVNDLKVSPRYNAKDQIFAHPTRALTQGCHMLAVTQNNQVHIGHFNGWLEQDGNVPHTLEMTVFESIDNQYYSKTIVLNRNEIKSSFRIIGLMEAA